MALLQRPWGSCPLAPAACEPRNSPPTRPACGCPAPVRKGSRHGVTRTAQQRVARRPGRQLLRAIRPPPRGACGNASHPAGPGLSPNVEHARTPPREAQTGAVHAPEGGRRLRCPRAAGGAPRGRMPARLRWQKLHGCIRMAACLRGCVGTSCMATVAWRHGCIRTVARLHGCLRPRVRTRLGWEVVSARALFSRGRRRRGTGCRRGRRARRRQSRRLRARRSQSRRRQSRRQSRCPAGARRRPPPASLPPRPPPR